MYIYPCALFLVLFFFFCSDCVFSQFFYGNGMLSLVLSPIYFYNNINNIRLLGRTVTHMTKKEKLLEQIEQSRFQPLNQGSYDLCQDYMNSIDSHDPTDLSRLLFYEGEYYFKSGGFSTALNHLSRFLQSPGLGSLGQLEALSYLISGRIYGFLGQEPLAVNYFLQCQSISAAADIRHEYISSSLALCCSYQDLEDYTTALHYCELARSKAGDDEILQQLIAVFRAIIYCKMKQFEDAFPLWSTAKDFLRTHPDTPVAPCIWNLSLRFHEYRQEPDDFSHSLLELLACISNDDFLNNVWYFFDICNFLFDTSRYSELKQLINTLSERVTTPFSFLPYRLRKYALACPGFYPSRQDYLMACDDYMNLHTTYLEEQRLSKIYGLAYMEQLQEAKNTSEMFREKSRLDQMTGLLNKYTVRFLIEEDLAHKTSPAPSAMLLIDLDHFKQINDTLGHLAGDNIICQTASAIQNYFKKSALCGRVGGDEFVIYLPTVTDVSSIMLQAEILRQEIFHKTFQQNITVTTQASIGVAFSSAAYHDYETLFAAADRALYRAKSEGRNRVVVTD